MACKRILIIPILLNVVCCGTTESYRLESSVEPRKQISNWFSEQEDVFDASKDTTWIDIDGVQVPSQFAVSLKGDQGPSLEFILVRIGDITVEGVTFKQHQYVYMSKTILSIKQALALKEYIHEQYDSVVKEYAENEIKEWEASARDQNKYQQYKRYINNAEMPYFVRDLDDINEITLKASRRWRCTVRVPTIAEWYRVMRCGRQTRYWWGETWNSQKVWMDPDTVKFLGTWESLQSVNDGIPNSWGFLQMVGGIWQVVIPSPEERATIRKSTRPGGIIYEAKRAKLENMFKHHVFDHDYWTTRYNIGPYAPLQFGGSTFVSNEKRLDHCAQSLSFSIANPMSGSYHPLYNNAVGIRLVIELPLSPNSDEP